MLFSWSDTVVYFFKPTLYPFFVLSAVHSESIEAFLHIVQFMHESLGLTGGHHFFSPQCSKTQKGHLYLGCRRTGAAGSFTVQWISKQANWFYLCFTQCTKALLSLQHIFELFQVINLRWRIEKLGRKRLERNVYHHDDIFSVSYHLFTSANLACFLRFSGLLCIPITPCRRST